MTKEYVRSESGTRYEVKDSGSLKEAPEHTGGALGSLTDAVINVVKTGTDAVTPSSPSTSRK